MDRPFPPRGPADSGAAARRLAAASEAAPARSAAAPRDEEDTRLLRRAASGEPQAFADLHDRYFGRLAGFASRLLRGAEESGDVVQDAFLALYLRLEAARSEAHPRHGAAWLQELLGEAHGLRMWLYAVVRHKAIDVLRSRARTRIKEPSERDGESWLGSVATVPRELPDSEELAALRACLERLPEHLRHVIDLLYFEQVRPVEVARILRRHPAAIGRRRDVAHSRLSACIEDKIGHGDPKYQAEI